MIFARLFNDISRSFHDTCRSFYEWALHSIIIAPECFQRGLIWDTCQTFQSDPTFNCAPTRLEDWKIYCMCGGSLLYANFCAVVLVSLKIDL